MINYCLVRGGGDLASGVAYRLFQSGIPVIITELANPLVVRRMVSFAQTVYDGEWMVEGVHAVLVENIQNIPDILSKKKIPVLVDPSGERIIKLKPDILVDARMLKKNVEDTYPYVKLVIGLGPGFEVDVNCNVVIETNRGHFLGRVYWEGKAEENTGVPGSVREYREERVLRSPTDGIFEPFVRICDSLDKGQVLGAVNGCKILAPFKGIVRGLIQEGIQVRKNMKIGDLDPRNQKNLCYQISEKSLAIGGGVLEAIMHTFKPFQNVSR